MEAKKEEMVPLDTSRAAFELWSIHNSGDSLPIEGAMWGNDWFYNDERTRAAYAMWRYLHRAYAPRVASVAPSQAPSFDVESMLRVCVPGGSICDPQQVADAIRAYFADGVAPSQAPRLLTDDEVAECDERYYFKSARSIQRKFCEVNGLPQPDPHGSGVPVDGGKHGN